MVEGTVFIGAVIIAVTQFIKFLAPNVNAAWTILVAVGVGVLVALLDKQIGVVDITVAQGVMIALGSSGVVTVADRLSTNPSR